MKNRTVFPLNKAPDMPKFNRHKYSSLAAYRRKNKSPRGLVLTRLFMLESMAMYKRLNWIVEETNGLKEQITQELKKNQ